MNANRITATRGPRARRGGVRAASPSWPRRSRAERVGDAHRLHRRGTSARWSLHVLGSGDAQASVTEFVHQLRRGMPLNKEIDSHHWVDGLNELQIRERDAPVERRARRAARGRRPEGGQGPVADPAADALPADPVRAADRLGAAQVPARRRLHPRRVGPSHRHPRRHRPRRCTSPPTTTAASSPTSSPSGPTIHGQPFELVLEGPAGGKFSQGVDGERVEIDALDFIRTLSGRLPGTGVLGNPLPL